MIGAGGARKVPNMYLNLGSLGLISIFYTPVAQGPFTRLLHATAGVQEAEPYAPCTNHALDVYGQPINNRYLQRKKWRPSCL